MINRTIMLSLALVAAGCAHKTYTGASYSGTTYSGSDNSNYSQSTTYEETTTKGDGARQLTTQRDVSDGTTIYTVVTPDAAAATHQGAGARALIGQTENVEIVSPDIEVTQSSTTQGAGARSLTTERETTYAAGGDLAVGNSSSGSGSLSQDDANFVREASQAGMAEVRMGELIQQKAENSSLKSFGEMLVNDHKKANEELQQIAGSKQLTQTASINPKDQAKLDKLSSLNGVEFDRLAQKDAVEAHMKAIKLFKHEAEQGKDAQLKAFAQKTLPRLEDHLKEAKRLKDSNSAS